MKFTENKKRDGSEVKKRRRFMKKTAVIAVSVMTVLSTGVMEFENAPFISKTLSLGEETVSAENENRDEARVLTEFEDSVFRREIVSRIGGENRNTLPENSEELLSGDEFKDYENPIFSTDIDKLKEIENFYYNSEDKPESEKIKSLKGIEHHLKGLKYLNVYGTMLNEINLEENKELETADIQGGNIDSADFSKNPKLKYISIRKCGLKNLIIGDNSNVTNLTADFNRLSDIDLSGAPKLRMAELKENMLNSLNLSENPEISFLSFSDNNIESIDLKSNTELESLYAERNRISFIDLSSSRKLKTLSLKDNRIRVLDLSQNKLLDYISIGGNRIENIDFSGNPELSALWIDRNRISELNLSENPKLSFLEADKNRMKCLDLSKNEMLSEIILDSQSIDIETENKSEFSLDEYLGFKPDSVIGENGVKYDSDKGLVTLPEGVNSFSYFTDVTSESDFLPEKMMKVKVNLIDKISEDNFHRAYMNGYSDGNFRPDGTLTRAEAAAVYSRLIENGDIEMQKDKSGKLSYSDVPGGWYEKYINYMTEKNLMNGYPDGSFRPDRPLTRAELSKMICEALKMKEGEASYTASEKPFTDTENHWAEKYIESIYSEGIVNGYSDGSFRPENSVTRAEAVKMFNILFKRGTDIEGIESSENPQEIIKFTDLDKNHWAYYEIMEASNSHKYENETEKRIEKWIEIY